MPLFRALAKNMAPMTNADESPTNRLTLFPIYLSLFIVSTLWRWQQYIWRSTKQWRKICLYTCMNYRRSFQKNDIFTRYDIDSAKFNKQIITCMAACR